MLPGSETKSRAKNVPSSKALNFNWVFDDGLFLLPITFMLNFFFLF